MKNQAPRVIVNTDDLFGKPQPRDRVAEKVLLGALILDRELIASVSEIIDGPDDFHDAAHATIYRVMHDLHEAGRGGDIAQLCAKLSDEKCIADVGGYDYLEKIASETPGTAGALHWARIVANKARLRRMIQLGGQIIYDSVNHPDSGEITGLVDGIEQRVFETTRDARSNMAAKSLGESLEDEFAAMRARDGVGASGVSTGFVDLDHFPLMLEPGEFVIVAARPSMGKTAFAMQLAEQVAGSKPVGIFSLEMSQAALVQRIISGHCGLDTTQIRSGRLGTTTINAVVADCARLQQLPLFVDAPAELTAMGLRSRARRMVAQHGVKVIVIDYLQLMTAPGRQENRQVEVASISRAIKSVAKELGVPVVCLSQLNRGPEARADNRPRMSDLRESGSIEQDADVVMLLHREEYYHVGDQAWADANPEKVGLAEVIIAKNRNGPTGAVGLRWDSKSTRFRAVARHDQFAPSWAEAHS
jgi:replicative DNA helicase